MLRGVTSDTATSAASGSFRPLFVDELTGRARSHLVALEDPHCLLHAAVVQPFLAMRAAALQDGIVLEPASSFRDFDRQCLIWNGKYRGERALLDRQGQPLDALALSPAERVEAILCWSALPGASRHHWGTDLDVYDGAALPAGERPQLVPAEYAPGGPFARLDAWLAAHAARFGFFRPYGVGPTDALREGVAPEPWHISHAAIAMDCLSRLTPDVLREALATAALEGAPEIAARLEGWHARFVLGVDDPPAIALAAAQADASARELGDHGSMV
jgi:LAS superfamily LD-carboxypeptidase LdcB